MSSVLSSEQSTYVWSYAVLCKVSDLKISPTSVKVKDSHCVVELTFQYFGIIKDSRPIGQYKNKNVNR